MSDALALRFARSLHEAGATGDGGDVFADLVRRHAEAHRRYHTFEHVAACLAWLDEVAATADRPHEVALALFFHDAVYEPLSGDNEVKSAELARVQLGRLAVQPACVDRIASYVMATRDHTAECADARLTVDLDLTILGAPPSVYDDFEQRIRDEFAQVPIEAFVPGRCAVLEGFLARDAIYATPFLHDRLERAARANLARRIDALRAARP